MSEELQILAAPGEAELVIRRSRFTSMVQACTVPAEAAAQLEAIRRSHPKATHHVSAWRLRDRQSATVRVHCDDDGEPGGTAGRPTLQVLETHGLVDALLVTVRYFGGIKLGAGGLVRAYATAAREAVQAARLVPLVPSHELWIGVDFDLLTVIEHFCGREGIPIHERRYTPRPEIRVTVAVADRERVERALVDATGGRVTITQV
ncbi:MAG: YigZ family protein [Candidatus Eisenbacteria sp.]|nr:YigZ family protein [Candidatus Eisenbacteria bacterium]